MTWQAQLRTVLGRPVHLQSIHAGVAGAVVVQHAQLNHAYAVARLHREGLCATHDCGAASIDRSYSRSCHLCGTDLHCVGGRVIRGLPQQHAAVGWVAVQVVQSPNLDAVAVSGGWGRRGHVF